MKVAVSPQIYMGRSQKTMKKRLPQPVKPRSLKAGMSSQGLGMSS